jgi:alkanesulfonate monooxygenase SsuD/methylene tetrahydromethanopterin reductase-like flavin-dependent oxidoreductase (luciferase family)
VAERGIFVAPFDELADPRLLARLAARAEDRGWDGFFLWDHIVYSPPVRAVLDPWIAMSAIACATERVRIGPLVTPPARRRPSKLARETAALDILSAGRLIFGVGLGGDGHGEFSRFGDPSEPREMARLLDEGLAEIAALWEDLEPRPVQRPRIPVWIAGRWPNRRPLRRAARWDGYFPIDMEGPENLAELVAELDPAPGFDVVVTNPAGTDPGPWEAAGATWCLTGFGRQPTVAEVEAAIDAC